MQINNQKLYAELQAAGVAGLPFSWSESGEINFSNAITPEQRVTIEAVFSAHDGTTTPPVYICSPWQIRKALNEIGLRQQVEGAVAASEDQALKDGWEFATEFRSNDPFVRQMGESLGKSAEEVAALIQNASTL